MDDQCVGTERAVPSVWRDLALDQLELLMQVLGGGAAAALALETRDPLVGLVAGAGGTIAGGAVAGVARSMLEWMRRRVAAMAEALSEEAKSRLRADDALDDEDLLHAVLLALEKASHARREEKARLFGRLLDGYILERIDRETDDYEEMLSILDDMSCREMEILRELDACERSSPVPPAAQGNELRRVSQFWDRFIAAASVRTGTPTEELPGLLARLARTGLYKPITGMYVGYGGDQGLLTPFFSRFRAALGLSETGSGGCASHGGE